MFFSVFSETEFHQVSILISTPCLFAYRIAENTTKTVTSKKTFLSTKSKIWEKNSECSHVCITEHSSILSNCFKTVSKFTFTQQQTAGTRSRLLGRATWNVSSNILTVRHSRKMSTNINHCLCIIAQYGVEGKTVFELNTTKLRNTLPVNLNRNRSIQRVTIKPKKATAQRRISPESQAIILLNFVTSITRGRHKPEMER